MNNEQNTIFKQQLWKYNTRIITYFWGVALVAAESKLRGS